MLKRLMVFAAVLLLLPLAALAELEYTRAEHTYIDFPTLDQLHASFMNMKKWIIVTPETLEENWDLVAARGDTEEEIRARYADEHFLFEAYSPELPADACFRAEMYENDMTREVWHFRHWTTAERRQLNEYLSSGNVLPDRDVYSLTNKGSNGTANVQGYFTNYPPATHESGVIRFDFRNGRMYVFSYCVSGRLLGSKRYMNAKDEKAISRSPLTSLNTRFLSEMQPRLPKYALDSAFPEDVAPGNVRVTGTTGANCKLAVTLDGEKIGANIKSNGSFVAVLPLKEPGEHEVVLTVTHSKFTDRVMRYTVRVSETLTPLTVEEDPGYFTDMEKLTWKGRTDPGAQVTLRDGETELAACTADETGAFSLDLEPEQQGGYELTLTAQAEGKEPNQRSVAFTARYADAKEGIKVFSKDLSETPFLDMLDNIEDYIGQKVKISIWVKEVRINDQGLALIGHHNHKSETNAYNGSYWPTAKGNALLYVNVPGYAQCQIGKNMILTVYATVDGTRVLVNADGEEEERIELTVDYGTYLVSK